jgi:hypothetical protein
MHRQSVLAGLLLILVRRGIVLDSGTAKTGPIMTITSPAATQYSHRHRAH